jgi:hypothetical protein
LIFSDSTCSGVSKTSYGFLVGFLRVFSTALGIWVGFLKQPALPGEAPQNKNSSKKFIKNKNH